MIFDFNTKNESFIEMAYELKNEGIKNWKFFLLLLDEELVGVDPYDPLLSEVMKLKIQKEVMNNYWYYIREVIRIPEPGGWTYYKLNKLNLALSFCMDLNLNIFTEGPRQSGKTIGINCRYTWSYHYGAINSQMAFSNKKLDDSKLNLKRFKEITELLPNYLKSHINPSKDRDNLDYIQNDLNKNSIVALPAPTSIQGADGLGRGFTMPCLWYDEFAFLKFNKIVYAAAAPALSKAKESAEENGTPYGITISTTPNDRDSDEGAYAYSILDSAIRFDEHWYDMSVDEIKEEIKKVSKNNFVYIKYNYWELGRDQEWFEEQCRNLNNDLMKIKRELLLEWTITNDRSPFTEEQLNNISGYIKKQPMKYFYVGTYKFTVYEELTNIFKKNWIISIDIGGGLQQDFTVITIIDPLTKRMKALFRSNNILGDELVELVHQMIATFFPNGVVVPERNSLGVPIIDRMMKDPVIRPRLYYETKNKIAERVIEDPRKSQHIKTKKTMQVFGQFTSGDIRKVMFNEILPYMIENEPENIIIPELFQELKTLERNRNGKIEAKAGAHDDVLMAWLIGLYALLYGKNINKFVSLIGDFSELPNSETVTPGQKYLKSVSRVQAIRNMPPELIQFVEESKKIWTQEPEQTDDAKKLKMNRNLKNLLKK